MIFLAELIQNLKGYRPPLEETSRAASWLICGECGVVGDRLVRELIRNRESQCFGSQELVREKSWRGFGRIRRGRLFLDGLVGGNVSGEGNREDAAVYAFRLLKALNMRGRMYQRRATRARQQEQEGRVDSYWHVVGNDNGLVLMADPSQEAE